VSVDEVRGLDARATRLDQGRVLRALGYPSDREASVQVLELLPSLVEEVVLRARPRAALRVESAFEVRRDSVKLAGGVSFTGPLLARAVAPATRMVLFALTLGDEVVTWLSDLTARDVLAGFVADAVASDLVEVLADRFQENLAGETAFLGLHGSHRYSPGYCDWSIGDVPAVLNAVAADRIGIALTEGGLMVPRKSLCGLVGFGPDSTAMAAFPCEECARDCPHRRAPHAPRSSSTAP
jgi:hypothetical protein